MKLKRMSEWWRVVKFEAGLEGKEWWKWGEEEQGRLMEILMRVAKGLLMGEGVVDRRVWRERMRRCGRCPVYARDWKQCLLVDGEERYGCGCYVPFKALVRAPYGKGCWWKEHVGEGGGWPVA